MFIVNIVLYSGANCIIQWDKNILGIALDIIQDIIPGNNNNNDETINYIISECSNLTQREYKTTHDWMGKVIPWALGKFYHTNKWYMYDPESVLENKMHKILWDFETQTDRLISARRQDRVIVNKKKKKKRICRIVDVAVPADHRVNLKESEKRDKYLELARELKQLWNMKVTFWPVVISALDTVTKGFINEWKSGDHPNCSTVEINQNTKESPGDLRRLAVTQTPAENQQLTLVWKKLSNK